MTKKKWAEALEFLLENPDIAKKNGRRWQVRIRKKI